ncbi:hypothetical protein CTA2_9211 [Colletotrichum tanaceti]|uniref:Uncharacterized protein n=1 Tax=Colletotrichum tanaceti TaxID=1306861 RepID=A0A4U6X648_9PEZI|nr:hypothetical protein CTA2_9211 [Colletotrichum tanaceti]TKW50544.1 hypothetical protein CTA1_4455 [Colletotrichum tanaceti]
MQTKIFAVAVAALSMTSVHGAITPKITIGNGVIVTPEIIIDPNQLGVPQTIFATLDLLRSDINKTVNLVNQLTSTTTDTVFDRIAQANAVIAQTTANVGAIVTKITQLVNILKSAPSTTPTLPGPPGATPTAPGTPSVPALPDIGGISEDLVREAQALARAITAQLQILQQQASGFAGLVLLPTYLAAQVALTTALATVGTISNLALGTSIAVLQTTAAVAATIDALLARVRNAQVKLNPVLVIGLNPEIIF